MSGLKRESICWVDVPDDIFAAARCPRLTGLCCVQIVWKGTKALGCAKKFCPSAWGYLECDYYPPGNVLGAFAQNVESSTT